MERTGAALLRGGCLAGLLALGSSLLAQPPLDAQSRQGPSAEKQVRQAIERIRRLDPMVNAVIAIEPDALGEARALDRSSSPRGTLFGLPVLVKDNIETRGSLPTTAGSLALRDNVTGRDAPLVARLREAGAIIVGKTNLSEWANIRSPRSISGWSAIGGQTRNPHALNRNPCGSSSGSGAAVAAGMTRAAIGTETDGSITCPAAVNGIVGFKPTVGLVSRTHVIPISHTQDTAGPMARSVREAAELLTAMAGSDTSDPATIEADVHRRDFGAMLSREALRGARLGVLRFATGFGTDPVFEEALRALQAQGAILVEIKAFDDWDAISKAETHVLLAELKANLNVYLAGTPPEVRTRTLADVIAFNKVMAAREMALFGQETLEEAQAMPGLDDPAYLKARAEAYRLAGPEGIDRMLRENNLVALIGPTMPPAWPIDAVNGDQISGAGAGSLAAVAGYPHLTVPMGDVRGLPVGLSFIGGKWSDGNILSLGYAYEQATLKIRNPKFAPSIEGTPEVAPLLRPLATETPGKRK